MNKKIGIILAILLIVSILAFIGSTQAMTFSISIAGDGTLKADTNMQLKTNNIYAKYNHRLNAIKAESFALKQDGKIGQGILVETDFEYVREPISLIGDCSFKENIGSGIMRADEDCKACAAGAYANVEGLKVHSIAEGSPTVMDYNVQMQGNGMRMAVGAKSHDENGTVNAMWVARHGTNVMSLSSRCERPVTAGLGEENLKMICPWASGRAIAYNDWRVFRNTNRS